MPSTRRWAKVTGWGFEGKFEYRSSVRIRGPLLLFDFEGKFLLCPKWGKGQFLALTQHLFDFSLNLLIRFFWNYSWCQALKGGQT